MTLAEVAKLKEYSCICRWLAKLDKKIEVHLDLGSSTFQKGKSMVSDQYGREPFPHLLLELSI